MTVEEIKNVLTEKCEESWNTLNEIEDLCGAYSFQAEAARNKWATYDCLFRELFNEKLHYKFN